MMAVWAGAGGASVVTQQSDNGKGDGTDVITIGDSWMHYEDGLGIQESLMRVSGQAYRIYGAGGARLLGGEIPNQYASARRANPDIKTVIMTGGGNDLSLSDARSDLPSAGPKAKLQIDNVAKRLEALWTEMGKDGVRDIVYVFPSRGGGIALSVDYATSKIQPICQSTVPAHCHWVDSDETIHMMLRDGIHPTDAGFDALGKTVYTMMEKEGMRR